MSRTTIGVLTLAAFGAALVIGDIAMWSFSITAGAAFLAWLAVSSVALVYTFCSKCSARATCAHVAPAALTRLLPPREEGTYSGLELAVTLFIAATWLLVPQCWLIRWPVALVVFWVLVVGAMVVTPKRLCPECPNMVCPLRPKIASG